MTQSEYNQKVRHKVITLLGGKCKKCGFSDIRALQIDHVSGGGQRRRKQEKSNRRSYHNKIISLIKKNPEQCEYQCLCANCNWIKRFENNELLACGTRSTPPKETEFVVNWELLLQKNDVKTTRSRFDVS